MPKTKELPEEEMLRWLDIGLQNTKPIAYTWGYKSMIPDCEDTACAVGAIVYGYLEEQNSDNYGVLLDIRLQFIHREILRVFRFEKGESVIYINDEKGRGVAARMLKAWLKKRIAERKANAT